MTDGGRERRGRALSPSEGEPKKPRRRDGKLIASPRPTEKPLVLVVDDEEDVRAWLRVSLSLEGWTVAEATTGEEAIEMWRRVSPDVVLLDQRMRGMSGLECAAELRSLSDETRIMLVTAHLDDEAMLEARRLRLLPLEKAEYSRLFEVLGVLAEQVRTTKNPPA